LDAGVSKKTTKKLTWATVKVKRFKMRQQAVGKVIEYILL